MSCPFFFAYKWAHFPKLYHPPDNHKELCCPLLSHYLLHPNILENPNPTTTPAILNLIHLQPASSIPESNIPLHFYTFLRHPHHNFMIPSPIPKNQPTTPAMTTPTDQPQQQQSAKEATTKPSITGVVKTFFFKCHLHVSDSHHTLTVSISMSMNMSAQPQLNKEQWRSLNIKDKTRSIQQ